MPFFYQFKCNACSFSLTAGLPVATYINLDSGDRVECPHIAESSFIAKHLNICETEIWNFKHRQPRWWWTRKKRNRYKRYIVRTGKLTPCVCTNLHVLELDYARDIRKCPLCASNTIRRVIDLEGVLCPSCRSGYIQNKFTGVIT
jgi:hypothetical protein